MILWFAGKLSFCAIYDANKSSSDLCPISVPLILETLPIV